MSFLWLGKYPPQIMLRIHIEFGLRRTCWDVGLTQGGVRRRCWGEQCTVRVSCRLPRGAFLQLMCSQNTWWKVKVQWGLSIFARIMLCLSVILLSLSPCPPLFIALLPFPRVIHVRTGEVFGSTSDPGQVHCADNYPIPISHHLDSVNPALRAQD